MNVITKPEPTATGSFAQKPLAHILVYLAGKRSGGTLEVSTSDSVASVYFQGGKPAKIHTEDSAHELGPILAELNFVERAAVDDAYMRASEQNLLLGEVLIADGKLQPLQLVEALKTQMFRRLVELFGKTTGNFAFYEGVNLLQRRGSSELFPVEPGAVILGGYRAHGDKFNLDSTLAGLKGRWVKLDNVSAVKSWRLNEAERSVCAALANGLQPFDALFSSGKFDLRALKRTLYTLTITKSLGILDAPPSTLPLQADEDIVNQESLRSIPPPSEVQPEEELSQDVLEKRLMLEEKAAAMASQNYFEMLGINVGAPPEEARKAYFKLVKTFHPDKLGKIVGPQFRDVLHFVVSNISEAHNTLAQPATHDQYLEQLTQGAAEAEHEAEVAQVLQAENAFQKGIVLIRREHFSEALKFIDQAVALQPEAGEYLGARAYLMWRIDPKGYSAKQAVEVLRRALELNPKSRRLHMFIGITLKADGRRQEARVHFQDVLRTEPHNVEAAREIRMIGMLDKREKESKGSGLLDRFFKKKD